MNKKKYELWILEQFKQSYNHFPLGTPEHSESPDFLIQTKDKIVGIEIAEIFQDSHLGKDSKLKQREVVHGKFGDTLLKILTSKLERKTAFMLSIEFSIHNNFTIKQIQGLVDQCWIECMEFLWNNSGGNMRIVNNGENLPKEINSIFILMLKTDGEPMHCNSQGGIVHTLSYEHIESTLQKHEKALKKYKNCDEYWLIIREGNYYAGSFSDIEINIETPINSSFDKVFILRTRPSSNIPIIILK